jgi:hypothetical protein
MRNDCLQLNEYSTAEAKRFLQTFVVARSAIVERRYHHEYLKRTQEVVGFLVYHITVYCAYSF